MKTREKVRMLENHFSDCQEFQKRRIENGVEQKKK